MEISQFLGKTHERFGTEQRVEEVVPSCSLWMKKTLQPLTSTGEIMHPSCTVNEGE